MEYFHDPSAQAPGFNPRDVDCWRKLPQELDLGEAMVIRRTCHELPGCILCEGVPSNLACDLLRLLTSQTRLVVRQLQPVAQRVLGASIRHSPLLWKTWNLEQCTSLPQFQALMMAACYGDVHSCTVVKESKPDYEMIHMLMLTLMRLRTVTDVSLWGRANNNNNNNNNNNTGLAYNNNNNNNSPAYYGSTTSLANNTNTNNTGTNYDATLHAVLKLGVRVWNACADYDTRAMPATLVSTDAMHGWITLVINALERARTEYDLCSASSATATAARAPSPLRGAAKWASRLVVRWLSLPDVCGPVLSSSHHDACSSHFERILEQCMSLGQLHILRLASSCVPTQNMHWSSLTDVAMRYCGVTDEEMVSWDEDPVAVCRRAPSEGFLCIRDWSGKDPNNASVAVCWAKLEAYPMDINLPGYNNYTEMSESNNHGLVVALEVCRASISKKCTPDTRYRYTPHHLRRVKELTKHDDRYVRHRAWLLLAEVDKNDIGTCEFVKDAHIPINYAATLAGCTSLEEVLEIGEQCYDFSLVAMPLARLCTGDDGMFLRVLANLCDSFVCTNSSSVLDAITELVTQNGGASVLDFHPMCSKKLLYVKRSVFASHTLFLKMPHQAIRLASVLPCPESLPWLYYYYIGNNNTGATTWSNTTSGCSITELGAESYVSAFCGAMENGKVAAECKSFAHMVCTVARKLCGVKKRLRCDNYTEDDACMERNGTNADFHTLELSRAEEKPHQGGCLVLEHFGSLVAQQNAGIPSDVKQLILNAIESAPAEFQWPVFRAAIACCILDGVEGLWRTILNQNTLRTSSSTRRHVFLRAIELVLREHPATLTNQESPWTNLVVDTYRILIRRKRCRDELRNDSDDCSEGMADVDDNNCNDDDNNDAMAASPRLRRSSHSSNGKYNRINWNLKRERANGAEEEYDEWKVAMRFSFPFAGEHEDEIMRLLESYTEKM